MVERLGSAARFGLGRAAIPHGAFASVTLGGLETGANSLVVCRSLEACVTVGDSISITVPSDEDETVAPTRGRRRDTHGGRYSYD